MKKHMNGILSAGICAALALTAFTGCGDTGHSRNLMDDVTTGRTGTSANNGGRNSTAADAVTYTDFAVRLFQECTLQEEGNNVLISPLSVINALAMTAGGSREETLAQMEKLFGADLDSLCSYLKSYHEALPSDEKYKLHAANSIWVKDNGGFTVSPDFLQKNAELANADVYLAPFDSSTLKDINHWVSENTNKMIPEILDQIPDDAVMNMPISRTHRLRALSNIIMIKSMPLRPCCRKKASALRIMRPPSQVKGSMSFCQAPQKFPWKQPFLNLRFSMIFS